MMVSHLQSHVTHRPRGHVTNIKRYISTSAFSIKVGIRQCRPRCRPTFALGRQNFADPVFKKTSVCEGRFFTHERDSVILPLVHRFYDTKESFSLLQLPF